jgi:hypothetical protein
VLPLAPTPSGEDYVTADQLGQPQELFPMDLFLCRDCGHAEFPDVIDPDRLYRNYKYQTSISLGLVEHFGRYADAVLAAVRPAAGSLVMDVGSNDGSLLKFFNNVFANIDNLADFAAGVRELLAPDGVFVFETSYLLDVLANRLIETFFHEHLSYFSVKPLQAYFHRHGMELFDLQHVPTKGGSIRGFVQLAGGARTVQPSVSEQIVREEAAGLSQPETFRACHQRVNEIKSALHRQLAEWKQQGKVIAGYGASVGVTTLLFQFDLGRLLEFLVDDNPIRHGLYSPGHHLPVLPSEALYSRKVDSVVVLAWAYFEPIRHKHQAFLNRGGHFIIPLPEVRVV